MTSRPPHDGDLPVDLAPVLRDEAEREERFVADVMRRVAASGTQWPAMALDPLAGLHFMGRGIAMAALIVIGISVALLWQSDRPRAPATVAEAIGVPDPFLHQVSDPPRAGR